MGQAVLPEQDEYDFHSYLLMDGGCSRGNLCLTKISRAGLIRLRHFAESVFSQGNRPTCLMMDAAS